MIRSLIEHVTGRRTAQSRWDRRWADPTFYSEFPIDEMAHYSIICGYALRLAPGGALLDVGCGAGVLLDHLHPGAFSTYVGIDFPQAIARTAGRIEPRATFVASDMRDYVPTTKFDTLVFNECLYYVEDAVAELERYSAFLKPGGVFLISLHRKPGSERVWENIARRFEVIDEVVVSNRRGTEWIIGALKPGSSGQAPDPRHLTR